MPERLSLRIGRERFSATEVNRIKIILTDFDLRYILLTSVKFDLR